MMSGRSHTQLVLAVLWLFGLGIVAQWGLEMAGDAALQLWMPDLDHMQRFLFGMAVTVGTVIPSLFLLRYVYSNTDMRLRYDEVELDQIARQVATMISQKRIS